MRVSYKYDQTATQTNNITIVDANNYYPFGLKHKGYGSPNQTPNYKYKYNGKELQDELGVNWYDYGARNYDAALGRWMNVDPLAEDFPGWTPYHYVHNNPINMIDPTGMSAEWIPGTDDNPINYTVNSEGENVWSPNTPEEFKEIANIMLETTIGSEVLNAALKSDIRINVKFSNESKIEGKSAEFGENIPSPLKNGKLVESNIIIYKGTIDHLNSTLGSEWSMENPETGGVMHSGQLSRVQNFAGTLGHEFIHSLNKESSIALSPNSKVEERERRPRQFSEMFYSLILNKK